jgi:hypothetical protein
MASRLRPILVSLALAGAPLLALSLHARAGAPEATAKPDRLIVVLDGALDGISGEKLRVAIATELGVDVALAAAGVEGRGTIAIKVIDPRRVLLVVRLGDDKTAQRVIELPADPALASETIALVVSNVLRDEASGLLAELRAKARVTIGSASASGSVVITTAPAASASATPSVTPPPPTPATTPATTSAVTPPPIASAPPRPLRPCEQVPEPTWWGVDFVPYAGSSTSDAGRHGVRALSFNAVGGIARGLRGFELGGVINLESDFVCGTQLAGAANVVGGPVIGLQMAGALNLADGPVRGAQLAGGANLATGDLDGVQIGGGLSYAWNVRGAQIASVNVASGRLRGAQVGSVNVVYGEVSGAQLGVINVAGASMHGVQVGVVNVSRDVDAPIGLVNVVTNGVTHLDAYATETGLAQLSLVHGGRLIHYVYGVGGRTGAQGNRFVASWGFGARLHAGEAMTLDLDAIGYWILRSVHADGPTFQTQLRLVAAIRLFQGLSLLVGPTYQVMTSYDPEERTQAPLGATPTDTSNGWRTTGWPGLVLGLRGL